MTNSNAGALLDSNPDLRTLILSAIYCSPMTYDTVNQYHQIADVVEVLREYKVAVDLDTLPALLSHLQLTGHVYLSGERSFRTVRGNDSRAFMGNGIALVAPVVRSTFGQ